MFDSVLQSFLQNTEEADGNFFRQFFRDALGFKVDVNLTEVYAQSPGTAEKF